MARWPGLGFSSRTQRDDGGKHPRSNQPDFKFVVGVRNRILMLKCWRVIFQIFLVFASVKAMFKEDPCDRILRFWSRHFLQPLLTRKPPFLWNMSWKALTRDSVSMPTSEEPPVQARIHCPNFTCWIQEVRFLSALPYRIPPIPSTAKEGPGGVRRPQASQHWERTTPIMGTADPARFPLDRNHWVIPTTTPKPKPP